MPSALGLEMAAGPNDPYSESGDTLTDRRPVAQSQKVTPDPAPSPPVA